MKTTMKKVLSMALALVLVMGMLPMAAQATTYPTPECFTAAQGGATSTTTHTHSATCTIEEHASYSDSEQAHVDNNSNNICDLCNADMTPPHTHTDADGLSGDANGHWNYCSSCNTKYNVASHTATTWGSDDTSHWQICTACGETFNVASHTSNNSETCSAKASCTICKREIGAVDPTKHVHAGSTLNQGTPEKHYRVCSCGQPFDYENHTWEAATATTPRICSVCGRPDGSALGTATISVKLLIGGTAQNAGSFSITAGGNKTANDILNTYLANSTYSASNISSSYVVDGSSTQYTGNQSVAITAGSTYVLYVTPVNSTNNTQSNTNGIYVSFVPNYNTYTYATYVAGPLDSGVKLYTDIRHNITRTGYTLEGWYYDAALTQRVPNDAVITSSATFYAKWTQIAPYNVSVVIYTNGNKQTPTVTLDLYEWAQDGVITLADLQQAVVKHGIKANNNAGLSVYGPFTPNQWTSYVSHDYFRNSTERVSVNAGEATVLYAMVHNVKITKGTVDPYGTIADKSNPKTGDMIYAPMMVLGLSASALAVLFYLNKKRAF